MSHYRRRKKTNYGIYILFLSVVLVILGLIALGITLRENDPEIKNPPTTTTAPTTEADNNPTTEGTQPTTEATEPPVTLVSTAKITATGDILMHMPCIEGGKTSDGSYDFDHYFKYVQDYVEQADYAVANLETTLAGLDNGYKYSGYPAFNCPDGIATSLKNVGFDMVLTANNHCYDTRTKGFHRTQQVVTDAGLDHIGTVSQESDLHYLVKEINGIRIGMVCYTYEDADDPNVMAPNGITMKDSDEGLINTFNVNDLNTFYQRIEGQIADMKQDGAEALVLYIHWGVEYQLEENTTQNTIAQKMCDLGIDVIVGGHPHVLQPMELLTSTENEQHKTLCLYSTGNALSNQRRTEMRLDTGHTEDGVLFNFTFAKYSDGTVRVEDASVIPTWVNKYKSNSTGKNVYEIYPLDDQIEDWKTQMNLSDSTEEKARASYARTMKILGEGMEQIDEYLEGLEPIA
jgi:poly-gamma-glutamate synthesis protein (capsule biosynthesis protein)